VGTTTNEKTSMGTANLVPPNLVPPNLVPANLVPEAANDAVVGMDPAGKITEFSPAAERMFGRPRAEVLGRLLADVIVPPGAGAGVRADVERCLATGEARVIGKRVELSALRRDGTTFPAELAIAIVDSTRNLTGFIRDISDRKESEQALRDSEERFRLLVECVKDCAIFLLDPSGHVASWNAGAQAFKGYTPAEIVGEHFSIFYTSDEREQGKAERDLEVVRETGRFEDEGWRVRKDGTEFWANVLITALRDSAGTLVGFAKVTRDLTERRKGEEAVKRLHDEENRRMQEANRLKSEFLANMSHELRTPLNAILGFAELMFKGKVGPIADDHKEYLGDILSSARHLLRLINDVLDLAKVESGKMEFRPETLDLGNVIGEVRDILRGLAFARRIRVETDVHAAAGTAVLDPSKLKQVLYNYVSNALKFTHEHGRVTIRVIPEDEAHVRIEVEDTGIGIPAEDTPRLFVEFQQLDAGMAKKYAGTGLGLALTKRIVEAQGGHVGVKSEPGKGSTFWAVLPRTTSGLQVVPAAHTFTHPNPATITRTVLVVDDSPAALRLMEATLKSTGYSASCFADPAEALRALATFTPAVIVLDVLMCDIDGFEVLDRIRAIPHLRTVPVVVWTVKDLSGADRERLIPSAQGIVPKGRGESEALLAALKPYLTAVPPGDLDAA
jgi:PAS domain S-box-containing protein